MHPSVGAPSSPSQRAISKTEMLGDAKEYLMLGDAKEYLS